MIPIDDSYIAQNPYVFTKYKKCVFIVGAGISVPSGIPDFRSGTGIFQKIRKELRVSGREFFDYSFGMRDRIHYFKYILEIKQMIDAAVPNIVHHFLNSFPRSRTYTQNIDGLEEQTGMSFVLTQETRGVYLHGNLNQLCCQYCGNKEPFTFQDNKENYSNNCHKDCENEINSLKLQPSEFIAIKCSECLKRNSTALINNKRSRPIGLMHPNIIHYNQAHPQEHFIRSLIQKDTSLDLLIVIGTSLKIEGVKKMIKLFSKYAKTRIYVDLRHPTKEWSGIFNYFYEGDCQDFVKAINRSINLFDESGLVPSKKAKEDVLKNINVVVQPTNEDLDNNDNS